MNRHDVPTIHLRAAAGQGRLAGLVCFFNLFGFQPIPSVGARLRFGKRWAFEGLVRSSGGVGHFWGAFASVDKPGGA